MTATPKLKNYLTEQKIEFNEGDSILIYTDGLTESRNMENEEYGLERLTSILEVYGSLDSRSITQKIQQSLEAFIGSRKPHDDVTFTCIHHR
jgi:serine phosphatase RsbU (regulator of sigma subunit)